MLEMYDLQRKLKKPVYQERIRDLRLHLLECQMRCRQAGISTMLVFEGWDGAGKGTHIGTLAESLDPRGFRVYPIGAPTQEEKAYPFLRRFWVRTPAKGQIAIFDRSWYGRVLVERVDELTPRPVWERAYEEIRIFERQLIDHGTIILKFWLHISKKEQKRRFRLMEKSELESFQVTEEDWRHHQNYELWIEAVEQMLQENSTHIAPWTIIEATQKRFAHVKILESIAARWEEALQERTGSCPTWNPLILSAAR